MYICPSELSDVPENKCASSRAMQISIDSFHMSFVAGICPPEHVIKKSLKGNKCLPFQQNVPHNTEMLPVCD